MFKQTTPPHTHTLTTKEREDIGGGTQIDEGKGREREGWGGEVK